MQKPDIPQATTNTVKVAPAAEEEIAEAERLKNDGRTFPTFVFHICSFKGNVVLKCETCQTSVEVLAILR